MSIKFVTSLPMTKSMKRKVKEFCNYIIQQLSWNFTINPPKMVALLGFVLELRGNILKLSRGVFNKKNIDGMST